MFSLKVMIRLIATMMLLSIGFVLYPQGSANAAKYCAELRGATATGHPDCSFSTHKECRAHVRAGGGGHCYKLRALETGAIPQRCACALSLGSSRVL